MFTYTFLSDSLVSHTAVAEAQQQGEHFILIYNLIYLINLVFKCYDNMYNYVMTYF